MTDNIYVQKGYTSRLDYIRALSEEYNVDINEVVAIARLLGSGEDFDGLVSTVQDMEN